ncbi:MAG: hypothetical protein FWC50_06485 [Planctomycetaceae bacterium]|nr:hypothetical protein [Planctomycetaceae bacterium]
MKTEETPGCMREGWLPESHPESGFDVWNDLQSYNEDDERETTTQPLWLWSQVTPRTETAKMRMLYRKIQRVRTPLIRITLPLLKSRWISIKLNPYRFPFMNFPRRTKTEGSSPKPG